MANPYDVVSRPDGLGTHENDLSYEGQPLSVADNVVLNRDGMIERRRGFKDFSSNLPDYRPSQLISGSNGTDRYAIIDNGLWYFDGSNWLRKTGSFGSLGAQYCCVESGNVYVTTSTTVVKVDLTTGAKTVIAGRTGVAGTTDGTGDAARFTTLRGIWGDGAGNMYVVDSGASSVRKVTTAGVATTVATGLAATMRGIWGDTSGNLYIADTVNGIRKVTTAGVASIFTTGTASGPINIWGDSSNLYVSCQAGGAVSKVTYPGAVATANWAVTLTVLAITGDASNVYVMSTSGSALYSINKNTAAISTLINPSTFGAMVDGIGNNAQFSSPQGMAIDSSGSTIYLCDGNGAALRKIYLNPLYTVTLTGSLGGTSTRIDGFITGPT